MNAADVWPDDQWDEAASALACVVDVSVDGGEPLPMMGLLAEDGELVIPTDWDDPPVADGVGHVIRIVLRQPRIRLRPGGVLSVLEGCHAWRVGYGTTAVAREERDGEPVRVIVASEVPYSVRANALGAELDRHGRSSWRDANILLCTGVLLGGFVAGWLIIRLWLERRRLALM